MTGTSARFPRAFNGGRQAKHCPDEEGRPVAWTGPALAGLATTLSWSRDLGSLTGLAPRLEQVNFHGRAVSLRGGIGVAAGAIAVGVDLGRSRWARRQARASGACRLPAAVVIATGASGIAGLVDDLDAGAHDGARVVKGLRGHLRALARGRVTTGALKIAVIGSGALVAGVLLARDRAASTRAGPARVPGRTVADAVTSAVAIASWANTHNLLDLRPGRALKAAALLSAPLAAAGGRRAGDSRALAAGVLGTVAAALPEDLAETTMLGDTGANALGALVGAALAAHPSGVVRAGAAAAGTALVLASEKVSFSRVISSTPMLATLDDMGRRRD